MSIVPIKMYTVKCDGCGKKSGDDNQFAGWTDESVAEDDAIEGGWIIEGKSHYCGDCHYYDDDDNLIFEKVE